MPYTVTDAFDLDFESPSPRGFYTGGDGYSVHIDEATHQSGKQSLQMKFTGAGDAKAVDPKQAAAGWKEVVTHLETLRKPAKDQELEWAIQNARVVLECMQMRANEVSRDQSMRGSEPLHLRGYSRRRTSSIPQTKPGEPR